MLKITHNAGFFSCCMIKLESIISYFNKNQSLPKVVDGSEQFNFYKNEKRDVTFDFFEHYDNIDISLKYTQDISLVSVPTENQFSDYSKINFEMISPILKKYFTASQSIKNIQKQFENKYNIDYDNICAVMYRGNDKIKEIIPPSYSEVIDKAKMIREKNPGIRFMIQTDEKEFVEEFMRCIDNCFHIEETPKINKNHDVSLQYVIHSDKKILYTSNYLASIQIMSKCKHIICTSGNGEMFIIMYRGSVNGVYQYLHPKEYIYGVKNNYYDPKQKEFWIIH